jgi:hypothetical protein
MMNHYGTQDLHHVGAHSEGTGCCFVNKRQGVRELERMAFSLPAEFSPDVVQSALQIRIRQPLMLQGLF